MDKYELQEKLSEKFNEIISVYISEKIDYYEGLSMTEIFRDWEEIEFIRGLINSQIKKVSIFIEEDEE